MQAFSCEAYSESNYRFAEKKD